MKRKKIKKNGEPDRRLPPEVPESARRLRELYERRMAELEERRKLNPNAR
jgi:hypothetical protein